MIRALGLALLLLGVGLRLAACAAHEVPRGDVVLDVGVARSLLDGQGFAAGFQRGVARVAGADAPVPPLDRADQHAPLWPLVGAALAPLAGSPFAGLKLGSLLAGLLTLVLVWRGADRLLEGVPGAPDGLAPLAAGLVAVCWPAIDASGNGSLYAAQALLVLVLCALLAAPRVGPVGPGLVLGALLLLNYQCAVLLPVPPLVLLLGARRGRRGRALLVGCGVVVLALLCQVPWWLRNAAVFGDPLFSVNGVYLLHRAGVPVAFALEDGVPVLRFAGTLGLLPALHAAARGLAPNLLYLLATGLLVWPGLVGVVAAGLPRLAGEGLRGRERRLLSVLFCALALGAVAVLWPATKLRYLVALVPLVALLGTRLLGRAPGRGERLAGVGVTFAWLAVLLFTADDLTGAPDARPLRWVLLAVGGLLLLALPLRLHRGRPVHGALRLLVTSGAALSPVLALLVAFGPGPGTAYNGAVFSPDFFGQPAEARAAGEAAALEAAHAELLARGAERVAGPVELLAWPAPTLVELPRGLGAAVLGPILDAWLSRGAVDHVVLFAADAAALREAAGTGPSSHLVTLARWPGAPGDDVLLLATGSR